MGGLKLGAQAAGLRAGGTGGPFRLFDADSELARSVAFEARVGFHLTPRFALEGRAALARPEWRTTVSGDFEGAPSSTLVERVSHYAFDGGLRIHLDEWQFLGMRPFLSAGAGYLRQLHEEQTLVEERPIYYAGGGVTRTLADRSHGFLRASGVRADLRVNVLGGGGSFGDQARRQASLSGGVFVLF